MSSQNSSLFIAFILITLIFFIVALGLIFLVVIYNQRRKKHLIEKQMMKHQFESELLKTQIEVQEQTMQTIASDLHDNIGQLLSLTALTLNSINLNEPQRLEKKVAESLNLVNSSIKELRGLAKLMHGELIVQTGLGNVIKHELDRLKKLGNYELKVKNELINIEIHSQNKDLIILRLLQEIINNIIKHSKATRLEFNIYMISEKIFLKIQDNGVGFDIENVKMKKSGMGLNSIFKRVALINGEILITSSPTSGTLIAIDIPYP
ncbi:sensor histidine kinase [Pedobacter frigiditerrae]|uniref:sensor histidine kinase n=1 Tax=Pedobacter frigiditerrae TaxID=2530452 RepID=UPI00293183CF|nr:ATP-binding protein [Pedobacter frigiditerrae]